MILYRYLDFEGGIKTLEGSSLKVTRPIDFNDPFEYLMRPVIKNNRNAFRKGFIPKAIETKYLDETVKRNILDQGIDKPTKKQIREAELKIKGQWRKKFDDQIQQRLDDSTRDRLRSLSENLGVVSFTTESNHNLMWSHYADGHKGMIVEIDSEKAFKVKPDIIKVTYHSSPPEIDMIDGKVPKSEDLRSKVIGYKSNHWEYENEYRIQFIRNTLKIVKIPESGTELSLFDIPKDSIRRVVVGCKMNEANIGKVKTTLKDKEYSHVKIQKAETSIEAYNLVYKDLNL